MAGYILIIEGKRWLMTGKNDAVSFGQKLDWITIVFNVKDREVGAENKTGKLKMSIIRIKKRDC